MSKRQTNPVETAAELLGYLRQLKNDRGAMAELRRALNPAQRHRAWPLLARVGGIGDPRTETVAGLYAYHPDETNQGNFGTTCRRLAGERAGESNSFDARFCRLLACDRDEVCERLRPVVFAAKAKGIGVNYERLLVDLSYWAETVKVRWAQEYWAVPEVEQATALSESEAAP